MASYMIRGESLFIPFRNGRSISDSQCKPRMYKSVKNFEKTFPKHNYGTQNIELVEYAEVKHGKWIYNTDDFSPKMRCSVCGYNKPLVAGENIEQEPNDFCNKCGADMRGGKNDL